MASTSKEVCIYKGFTEHAWRLVFPYEDHFAPNAPRVLTVMPSGVIETNEVLKPQKEDALIAFVYPQSISDELADSPVSIKTDEGKDDGLPAKGSPCVLRETAFVWRRDDGTNALVQTWPTELNEKFRKTFEISQGVNPDSEKFQPQAVAEFQESMVRLFGPTAKERPIWYCHKVTVNASPAVTGITENVLAHIKEHSELMHELAILSVDSDGLGFVADGTSGDGSKFEQHFTLTAGEHCVVYKKVGWDTMGCTKPLHQFLRDADLREPPTVKQLAGINESAAVPMEEKKAE